MRFLTLLLLSLSLGLVGCGPQVSTEVPNEVAPRRLSGIADAGKSAVDTLVVWSSAGAKLAQVLPNSQGRFEANFQAGPGALLVRFQKSGRILSSIAFATKTDKDIFTLVTPITSAVVGTIAPAWNNQPQTGNSLSSSLVFEARADSTLGKLLGPGFKWSDFAKDTNWSTGAGSQPTPGSVLVKAIESFAPDTLPEIWLRNLSPTKGKPRASDSAFQEHLAGQFVSQGIQPLAGQTILTQWGLPYAGELVLGPTPRTLALFDSIVQSSIVSSIAPGSLVAKSVDDWAGLDSLKSSQRAIQLAIAEHLIGQAAPPNLLIREEVRTPTDVARVTNWIHEVVYQTSVVVSVLSPDDWKKDSLHVVRAATGLVQQNVVAPFDASMLLQDSTGAIWQSYTRWEPDSAMLRQQAKAFP